MCSEGERSLTSFRSAGQAVIFTTSAHSPLLSSTDALLPLCCPVNGASGQPGLSRRGGVPTASHIHFHIHGVRDTATCRYGEAAGKVWDCWRKLALVAPGTGTLDKGKLQRLGVFKLQTSRCCEFPGYWGIPERRENLLAWLGEGGSLGYLYFIMPP